MIYPHLSQYLKDAETYNLLPVFKEIPADFETPLTLFLKANGKFLLESVESGYNLGRYSFIGLGKKSEMEIRGKTLIIREFSQGAPLPQEYFEMDNPLEKVREYFHSFKVLAYDGLPPFFGGAVGYLGYEAVQFFENIPVKNQDGILPDGLFVIPETLLVFDSVKRSVLIIICTVPGSSPEESYSQAAQKIEIISKSLAPPLLYGEEQPHERKNVEVRLETSHEDFLKNVERCQEYIQNGEAIQIVLSQKIFFQTDCSPFELYRRLRIVNPSPYLFFLDFEKFFLIGSSPEVMVRLQNRELLLKPIAGTRRRGVSIEEDHVLARELLEDPKERAEHIMLVDLGRNDLGRIAVPGTVQVTDFMAVEKYSHVMHIVSTIKAELDSAYDVFDVIRATFPAGTVTGAPKIRAMEIISELEPSRRGPYGGMIFYLGFNGNLDSCITIRTIVLKDRVATVQAGAGVVADSMPEAEYEETLNKAGALISTVNENLSLFSRRNHDLTRR